MSEALALKYRPRAFADMVGQPTVAGILAGMVEKDTVPVGLLFHGTHGTGKTSAARILAHELNPAEHEAPTVEIDAASNGGVAEVRQLIQDLQYGFVGAHRVVIIDECHSMSREAYNALLKTLEEPPGGTIFVLVTTEPHKVPETVLSRLISFEFRRVTPQEIFERLVQIVMTEAVTINEDLLQHIALTSDGSVRDAIMKLDQAARAGIVTVEDYRSLARVIDVGPPMLKAVMTGDPSKYFMMLDTLLNRVGHASLILEGLTDTIKDLMVLKAGGSLAYVDERLEHRKQLAAVVTPDQLTAVVKVIWDLKTRIRFNDNAPSNLSLALVLMAEIFSKK